MSELDNWAPAPAIVLGQLNRIKTSRRFTRASKLSSLLQYVVTKSLHGHANEIRQYNIAIDVFERDASFDPSTEPLVRIQAGRLRRALANYYEDEGRDDAVLISIPSGGYAPKIALREPSDRVDTGASAKKLPALAVLPLVRDGSEAEKDYFAVGFSEQLTDEFARHNHVRVVAQASARHAWKQTGELRACGDDLKVNYLLAGSVRNAAQRLQLSLRLYAMPHAEQVWNEHFDIPLAVEELLEVKAEVIRHVAARITDDYGVIQRRQAVLASENLPQTWTAYDALLRYYHFQLSLSPEDFAEAHHALESALVAEPFSVQVLAALAMVYMDASVFEYAAIPDAVAKGINCAERAVRLDPLSQHAQHALAFACLLRKDRPGLVDSARRMVELNPAAAFMVGNAGFWLCLAGEFDEGLSLLESSRALNPHFPFWFSFGPFLHCISRGNYEGALASARPMGLSGFFWCPLANAAALALLGRQNEATDAYQALLALKPDFPERAVEHVRLFVLDEGISESILNALGQAANTFLPPSETSSANLRKLL